MNELAAARHLRIALVAVGVTFVVGIYTTAVVRADHLHGSKAMLAR